MMTLGLDTKFTNLEHFDKTRLLGFTMISHQKWNLMLENC